MKLNKFHLSLILLGCSHAGFLQAFDLKQAYEAALVNDPTFRVAIKEYEAGLANETIGRSAMLPKINASYYTASNYAKQWGAAYSGGPRYSNTYTYPSDYGGAFLNQPLFSLEAIAKWKQGNAQADAARAQFVFNSQDLLVRVLQSYLDVLYAEDQLNYLIKERDAYKSQASVYKHLQTKGEGKITDVLEATASYQLAESKVIEAEDALKLNRQKLSDITKIPFAETEHLKKLGKRFKVLNLQHSKYEDVAEAALNNNQELLSKNNQIEAARQEYRINHAGYYPTVSLVGGISAQNSNTPTSIAQSFNQNYVGVQVNLPILTGGETIGRSNQSFANFEKSQAERDVAIDRVLAETRKQYDLLKSTPAKLNALEGAEHSSETLVKATYAQIKKGEKISVDALLAERSLYLAKRDLAQAKYSYMIGYMRLGQLTGALNVSDLVRISELFNR